MSTQTAVTWDEFREALFAGTFGDPDILRRLAADSIERDLVAIGAEGCGISSSDINHVLYGAIAWGIRYGQGPEAVQDFLRAR